MGLDANDPDNQLLIDKLRVHVDRIRPVYRKDVKTEWFDTLPEFTKNLMHPYDRDKPPAGEGWVVQVFGHHYNPEPAKKNPDPNDYGPYYYTIKVVYPRFNRANLRRLGVNHPALRSFVSDAKWTPEKAEKGRSGATELLLARGAAKEGSGATGATGVGGGKGGASDVMAQMKTSTGPSMANMRNSSSSNDMMMKMGGGTAGRGAAAEAKPKIEIVTRQRTDFVIEFVYQPPAPGAKPKTDDEIYTEMAAAEKSKGAAVMPNAAQVQAASLSAIQKKQKELEEAGKKAGESTTPAVAPGALAPGETPPSGATPKQEAAPPGSLGNTKSSG